jgi:hypothetical protein
MYYPFRSFPSHIHMVQIMHLVLPVQFHALLQLVSNGTLPGGSALGESDRATERTSSSAVTDAHDANVGGSGIASHTGGHLNLHVEVGVGGKRETLNSEAWDVLNDLGGLHGSLASSAGCAVDIGSEGTSTILVNLVNVRGNLSE